MTPLHPVLVFGTATTLWVVLCSTEVLVVGTALAPSCVSATVMGYVGATGVAPVFPLFLDPVMITFLVTRSCLAPGGSNCEFTSEFLGH